MKSMFLKCAALLFALGLLMAVSVFAEGGIGFAGFTGVSALLVGAMRASYFAALREERRAARAARKAVRAQAARTAVRAQAARTAVRAQAARTALRGSAVTAQCGAAHASAPCRAESGATAYAGMGAQRKPA